ncbi:MAG: RNA-binding S4 domain-containing protein [Tissierellia bacterium]|nr:RNA-binding S4 domain-containing protein [Tissierellia bacterium]
MRVDKFLKNSRIIKRRTVAKEAADGGRIKLNGKVAKAGDEVRVGDIMEIALGSRVTTIRIQDIRDNVGKQEAQDLYEIINS